MRVKRLHIENYISVKNAELTFGDYTALIGKNGSGKSSILEALYKFFSDFTAVGGGVPAGLSEYIWFRRDVSNPIVIEVTISLDISEFKNMFNLSSALTEKLQQQYKDQLLQLTIKREIVSAKVGWRTAKLNWCGIDLVKMDKPISLEEITRFLTPADATKDYTLYYFTAQKIAGDRLLVDKSKKKAWFSNPQIDSLVSSSVLSSSSETEGQNFKEWALKNDYQMAEVPPAQEDLPFILQPMTQEALNALLANLSNGIKGKLKFIPVGRDNRVAIGMRTPITDQAILDSLRSLSISLTIAEEQRWDKFRRWIENFISKDIDPNPTQLLANEQGLRFPLNFLGGGEQELITLLWYLLDRDSIVVIEEPESHFHPSFTRALFQFFKQDRVGESQILLSTHSPVLADKVDIENNWLVSRINGITNVRQIKNREEMKLILAELGVVPSDIYLKDFVLFVEGGTEKEAVLPVLLAKLGFKNADLVSIISLGGDAQTKNYLKIWLGIMEAAPVEYLILLDKGGESIAIDFAIENKIDLQKFIVSEKQSMEDYYPINLVKLSLKDLFGITVSDNEIDPKKRMDKEIERILTSKNKLRKRWKIDIGEYVAENMTLEQIPSPIKQINQKLSEHFEKVQNRANSSQPN